MRANNPIVTFHLEGELGKLYGSEFRFAARSIAHGLRSMCYQLKGDDKTDPFIDVLSKGYYSVVRNGREIDIEELDIALGKTRDVYIVPVPEGEGGGGAGKLIFGALLVAGAFLLAGPGGLAVGGIFLGGAAPAVSFGQIAAIGGLIAAAGAAQLLSPTPGAVDTRVREAPEERPSFLIDSLTNTTEEGAPVPIVHGQRILIGSHVISAGLDVEQTSLDDLIETEGEFESVHIISQGVELSSADNQNTEFRGFSTGTIAFIGGSSGFPFPFSPIGSMDVPIFRGRQILEIVEGHMDTGGHPFAAQHFLRVTMLFSPSDYFTSIKIEQPSGSTIYIKLSEDATVFTGKTAEWGTTSFQNPDTHVLISPRGTIEWEWAVAPAFIFDGTTDLKVTFGYD